LLLLLYARLGLQAHRLAALSQYTRLSASVSQREIVQHVQQGCSAVLVQYSSRPIPTPSWQEAAAFPDKTFDSQCTEASHIDQAEIPKQHEQHQQHWSFARLHAILGREQLRK
jgi:hypothetical protein